MELKTLPDFQTMTEQDRFALVTKLDREKFERMDRLTSGSTYLCLDHIVVPGEYCGDALYAGFEDIPQPGSFVDGYIPGETRFLFKVIGFALYTEISAESKSIGALLLAKVAPL